MEGENGEPGMTYELPYKAAKLSEFLHDAAGDSVEDDEDNENGDIVNVDVSRVRGECLGKVVEFLKHYAEEPMKEIPTPLGGSSFNEVSNDVVAFLP